MTLPKHIERWTDPTNVAKHPEAVSTIIRIYNKYNPVKQQFIAKLNGTHREEESLLRDATAEDSKEFMSAMSRIKRHRLYVKRCGRGHRHGNSKWRSYLPLDKAESFAVYVYQRYDR